MTRPLPLAALLAALAAPAAAGDPPAAGSTPAGAAPEPASYLFRDTPIAELFEMISRRERINIVLGKGVGGNVAISLYDMTPRQAIYAIAEAGGYQVVARDKGYLIVSPAQAAQSATGAQRLDVRAFKVQYSEPQLVADILGKHVGPGGKVTVLPQRRMVVAEDTAEGLARLAGLLREVDLPPRQVMIEAKILEITLNDNESLGIDWTKAVGPGRSSNVGVTGLAQRAGPGLFFNYINCHCDFEAYLSALSEKGRVRTLATPKLLALEDQEASINIGDKLGYRLTTTINNVTAESVQFLETGVILRVTPSVDTNGKIVLRVKPEVSTGSVQGGVPSKKTTEVSTNLVAEDGQPVLMAGLIKSNATTQRTGVPLLGSLPLLGYLFANHESRGLLTETVVLITPRLVPVGGGAEDSEAAERIRRNEKEMADAAGAAAAL